MVDDRELMKHVRDGNIYDVERYPFTYTSNVSELEVSTAAIKNAAEILKRTLRSHSISLAFDPDQARYYARQEALHLLRQPISDLAAKILKELRENEGVTESHKNMEHGW